MNPAPTPRTDAEMFHAAPEHGAHVSNIPPAMLVTSADFARTLERELASAQAALAAKDAEIARLTKERDDWHSAHSIRSDELDGAVGMLNEAKAHAEKAEAEREQLRALWKGQTDGNVELLARAEKAEAQLDSVCYGRQKEAEQYREVLIRLTKRAEKAEAELANALDQWNRLIGEHHKAGDAITELRADRDALRAEVERLNAENAELLKERDEADTVG